MYISVSVIPKAKQTKVVELAENTYKMWISVAPEKGKANAEVISVLADYLGCKKNQLRIISGQTSRDKVLERIA